MSEREAPPEIRVETREFRQIDGERILETIERLRRRIDSRFPGSGLGRVCADLQRLAFETIASCQWLARPHFGLRVLEALLVAVSVGAIGAGIVQFQLSWSKRELVDLIQLSEAAVNVVILLGAGIFSLMTIEKRLKRSRAMEALHQMRSLAHVVDLHQLTKDPERVDPSWIQSAASPVETLSAAQLDRYLDYSSEMLALVGKLAALHAQVFHDPVVLAGVTQVEALTASLSHKIWQKILVLKAMGK